MLADQWRNWGAHLASIRTWLLVLIRRQRYLSSSLWFCWWTFSAVAVRCYNAGTAIVGTIGYIAGSTSRERSTGYRTGSIHVNLLHFWRGALFRSSIVRAALLSSEERNYIYCFVLKQQFSIHIPYVPQVKNNSRRVPAQYVLFALILWYVAKTLFRS